jgi:hypothetical protein
MISMPAATKAVGGRIVAGVGLSFDDPTSDLVNKQDGSDELAGDHYRIASEEGLGQRCCHAPVSVTS